MNTLANPRRLAFWLAAVAVAFTGPVLAKVPQAEADKLKNGTLTPMGAEPGGNADNSIPKWDGGLKAPKAGEGGRFANPFPEDKPKFTIDKSNLEQYKKNLTIGQQALFAKYPTYKMPVYESRRSAAFPDFVYEWNHKNALAAELTNNGNGFQGAAVGIPFPIPQSGVEPVWNHKGRYRGESIRRWNVQAPVTVAGDFNASIIQEDALLWYNKQDMTPEKVNNVLAYFMQIRHAPAIIRGEVLLVKETLDQVKEARDANLYNPGQRRVRKAPNVGHDNPGTASDGLRTNDQLDTFNGSMERYEWKLVGKQEIYIPYNSGEIHQTKYKYKDLVRKSHLNQEPTRYELHRVWVVDSTLKSGTSHVYGRRTYYVDEDSWQIALVDVYDKRNQMWRVQEAHTMPAALGGKPSLQPVLETVYDLQSTRYLVMAMNNEHDETKDMPFNVDYFTTGNMKAVAPK